MRILSAFFAVLFTFINPTMIVNVISQVEAFLNMNSQLPDHLRFNAIDFVVNHLKSSDHRIKLYVYGCGELIKHQIISLDFLKTRPKTKTKFPSAQEQVLKSNYINFIFIFSCPSDNSTCNVHMLITLWNIFVSSEIHETIDCGYYNKFGTFSLHSFRKM